MLLFQVFFVGNDYLGVILGMPDKVLNSFMDFGLIDPDLFFSSHHVPMFIIGFKELGKF